MRSELKEKEHVCQRMKNDYEKHMEEIELEYAHERDCLENHMEQLKMDLFNVHDRQASMTDNMTSSIADMLREKDEIIAQLEDKVCIILINLLHFLSLRPFSSSSSFSSPYSQHVDCSNVVCCSFFSTPSC